MHEQQIVEAVLVALKRECPNSFKDPVYMGQVYDMLKHIMAMSKHIFGVYDAYYIVSELCRTFNVTPRENYVVAIVCARDSKTLVSAVATPKSEETKNKK